MSNQNCCPIGHRAKFVKMRLRKRSDTWYLGDSEAADYFTVAHVGTERMPKGRAALIEIGNSVDETLVVKRLLPGEFFLLPGQSLIRLVSMLNPTGTAVQIAICSLAEVISCRLTKVQALRSDDRRL